MSGTCGDGISRDISIAYAQPNDALRQCYGELPSTSSMPCEHTPYDSPVAIFIFVVAALAICFKVVIAILVWKKRKEDAVRFAQPMLSGMLVRTPRCKSDRPHCRCASRGVAAGHDRHPTHPRPRGM